MYAELIYTRCGSGVDILKNMAAVTTSGFKVYSCSRSVVENGDLDLNLLLAVCQRKAAFKDPDVMDDAYCFEVTENGHKILSCFHPLHFNPNASGNYANRPGNFINQVIVSSFEGLYPYETFGCKNLWNACDHPEEYFYVNKPEILPERKVDTGTPVITDEAIRNFINEGRTELLKQAVCFIIEQFQEKNDRQKFLVIKDKSNLEIQLWIAAIESAFSPAIASSIPFAMCMPRFESSNRYGIKNGKFVPDINLKDPDQHQRLHAMIVGIDSRLWTSSVLKSSDYVVLDAEAGTIDYQGVVSEPYYDLVAVHNMKKIRFFRDFLQHLNVKAPCVEILKLADFYISLEENIQYLGSFCERIKLPNELVRNCTGKSVPLQEVSDAGHIFEDGNIKKLNKEFDSSRFSSFMKGFEETIKSYKRNQNSKADSYSDELLHFVQSICVRIRIILPTEGEKLTKLTLAALSAEGNVESVKKLKNDIQVLNNYLEKRKRERIEKILLKGISITTGADSSLNSGNVSGSCLSSPGANVDPLSGIAVDNQNGLSGRSNNHLKRDVADGNSIPEINLKDDVTEFSKQSEDTSGWVKCAADNLFCHVTKINTDSSSDAVSFSFAESYKIIESAFVRNFGHSAQPFSILFQNAVVFCIKNHFVNKDLDFAFFINASVSDELDMRAVIAEIDIKLDIGRMLAGNCDRTTYILDAKKLYNLNSKGIYLYNSFHIMLLCDSTEVSDDIYDRIVQYDVPVEDNDLYIKEFIHAWLERTCNCACDDKISEHILKRQKYFEVALTCIFSSQHLCHEKLRRLLKNVSDRDDVIQTVAKIIAASENRKILEKTVKKYITREQAKILTDEIKGIVCDYPQGSDTGLYGKVKTRMKSFLKFINKPLGNFFTRSK